MSKVRNPLRFNNALPDRAIQLPEHRGRGAEMSQSLMQNWRILYHAAIFEKDRNLIPKRISDAENALINRGRELLYDSCALEERDQIDDALYALRAYRTACEHLDEVA